jgi:hypothetical protein
MVGAERHNQFWDGPAGSFEQITFIMKNTKQPNPRCQNGLFGGALKLNFYILSAFMFLIASINAEQKKPNIIIFFADDLGAASRELLKF